MTTALIVIAILVLLIVVHEFGHFIAAKLLGVKVEEFGVGYPPRAFTFGTLGGTEYTLNWLPFGGFVRLFGDEGETERGRGSFIDAAKWRQAIILVAGVAMNAIGAWALFTIALHIGMLQPVASAQPGQSTQLYVADVVPGSPAYAAGMEPGDRITYVEALQSGDSVKTLTPESVVEFVRDHPGKRMRVEYMHAGENKEAIMAPAQGVIMKEAGQPALGIALVLLARQSENWSDAARGGVRETLGAFKLVFTDLGSLAGGAVHGKPDLSQVVGPVGIVGYVGEAAQNGIGAVLMLAGVISVNLAIINLIPIPALDGGRLFVLLIEVVMRRRAPRLAIQMLNAIGVSLIVILMLTVTYHDITRLIG